MKRRKGMRGTASRSGKQKKAVHPAKVFIYGLALAALGGGSYLLYSRMRSNRDTSDVFRDITQADFTTDESAVRNITPGTLNPPKTNAPLRSKSNDDFPLKKGSKGARVVQLQEALIKKGAAIKADGKFGAAT